jgi:hypothetical protein
MKIEPVGAELFHGNGQTDKMKLMVAFRNSRTPLINAFVSVCVYVYTRARGECVCARVRVCHFALITYSFEAVNFSLFFVCEIIFLSFIGYSVGSIICPSYFQI